MSRCEGSLNAISALFGVLTWGHAKARGSEVKKTLTDYRDIGGDKARSLEVTNWAAGAFAGVRALAPGATRKSP